MPETLSQPGILYLLPTSLGNENVKVFLPDHVISVIHSVKDFIVENEKTARQFLKQCQIPFAQSELQIHELDKHADKFHQHHFLDDLMQEKNMGLMSEAGCPGIADPGAEVIALAHQKNIRVVPLVGPSSLLLALMASGLNGQQFYFHGYLPKDKTEVVAELKKLEAHSQKNKCTEIFIETPYRNNQLVSAILSACNGSTRLCVACDLTLPTEMIRTMRISEWKKVQIDFNKRPCVFLLLS